MRLSGRSDDPTALEQCRQRVLVVDDEEDIREMLAEFLSLAGYEVLVAANGLESLNTAMTMKHLGT
jgi:CheY-like chemotaxis protein